MIDSIINMFSIGSISNNNNALPKSDSLILNFFLRVIRFFTCHSTEPTQENISNKISHGTTKPLPKTKKVFRDVVEGQSPTKKLVDPTTTVNPIKSQPNCSQILHSLSNTCKNSSRETMQVTLEHSLQFVNSYVTDIEVNMKSLAQPNWDRNYHFSVAKSIEANLLGQQQKLESSLQLLAEGPEKIKLEADLRQTRAKLEKNQEVLSFFTAKVFPDEGLSYFLNYYSSEREAALYATKFIESLIVWVKDASPSKPEAACRIFDCYAHQSSDLDLCRLQLSSLPSEMHQLVNLKKLRLVQNCFENLPLVICKLVNLEILYLSRCGLRQLPEQIGALCQLSELDLCNNMLETLPKEIGRLENLKFLTIEKNRFTIFPLAVCDLKNLSELTIEDNQLVALPSDIGRLTSLTKLDLAVNRIEHLPREIGNLINLMYLSFYNNQLEMLPPEISQLINLQELFVGANLIQSLPSSLARLPITCTINATNSNLSYEAIQTFRAQIDQQRALNPNLGPHFEFSIFDQTELTEDSTLLEMVTFWITQLQGNFSKDNVNCQVFPEEMFDCQNFLNSPFYKPLAHLDEEKSNNLKMFLMRLKQTDDFKHPSSCQPLIANVARMLHGICTNEAFSEKCFLLLEDALSTCGDRVANAFNMIYLQHELLCSSKNAGLSQLAKLIIGARRLDILEGIGRQLIKERKLGDAIESLLFLKVNFPDLEMPVATQGMLYPGMSGITDQDLQTTRQTILNKTSSPEQVLEILLSSEEWRNRIIEANKTDFEDIDSNFGEKIEAACTSSTRNVTAVLEDLEKQRNQATLSLLRILTQAWLKGEGAVLFKSRMYTQRD